MKTYYTENTFVSISLKRFNKNKSALWAIGILFFLLMVALLAPVLSNHKPLYIKISGQHLFPAFSFKNNYELPDLKTNNVRYIQSDIADWKRLNYDMALWPPVAYSPGRSEKNNHYLNAGYKGPFDRQYFLDYQGKMISIPWKFRHWLGTGNQGEDILAGLIHGTRISLLIGLIAMVIAAVIGILLGAWAGYFGDNHLKMQRGRMYMLAIGILLAFYYGFFIRAYILSDALEHSIFSLLASLLVSFFLSIVLILLFWVIGGSLSRFSYFSKSISLPVDTYISKSIEIWISIPKLVLIIAAVSIINKPSIINLIVLIGLTSWTGIARLVRAEMLKIRSAEYIQAGKALGLSDRRLIFGHALPNAMAPALVAIAFGVASAILIESGLSFLGIGVPHDVVTWGTLLSDGKENFNAWWLIAFPGLAIFITVTAYNMAGEGLRDAFDPKM